MIKSNDDQLAVLGEEVLDAVVGGSLSQRRRDEGGDSEARYDVAVQTELKFEERTFPSS